MSLPTTHHDQGVPPSNGEPAPHSKPLNFGTEIENISTTYDALSGAVVGGLGSAATLVRQALGNITSAAASDASASLATSSASTANHDALATGAAANDATLPEPASTDLTGTSPQDAGKLPAIPDTGNGGVSQPDPPSAPPRGRPVPCEAFDFDLDLLEKILAEQRASQAASADQCASEDTPTQTAARMPLPARASSTTLPSQVASISEPPSSAASAPDALTASNLHGGANVRKLDPGMSSSTAGKTLGVDEPVLRAASPSALSVTSVKSGVVGTAPHDTNAQEFGSNVGNWSADVAEASSVEPVTIADDTQATAHPDKRSVLVPADKGAAKRLLSARVVPLYDGFYLTEPSPPVSGDVATSHREQEVPRLSHAGPDEDSHSDVSDVAEGTNNVGLEKRVSLSKRIRGEAKVIAGKLRKDDVKVAEGRALKGGRLP